VNSDSQAIAGYNGAGPFRIINNYLEGAGENVLFGGSDPAVTNLVPSNIQIRQNLLTKPLAWRNAILAPPASPKAVSSSAAGSLASGTHYFKVVAVMSTDTVVALSAPSAEVQAAQSSSGKSITVSWSAVSGADRYRIYHGRSAGGETVYLETSGKVTSFAYTGSAEKSGTPAASGTKWTVKNALELKNAQQVTIDGNVIENVWAAGQYGYAILVTPRNQNGGASWVRVRDVTISNNIVRHAAGAMQLAGKDSTHTSQQTQRIALRNNLFYDIDPAKFGGLAKVFLLGEGPAGVVFDHNTIVHTNSSVVYAYGTEDVTGFVYTNNISRHNAYGIMGEGGRPGQYSIDLFFPASTITNNVLAGGPAASYPQPNSFPTVAQWDASFVNAAAADYRLLSSSVFFAAGAGGSIPGANIGTVNAAIGGTVTVEPPPVVEEPPPPTSNAAPVARPGGPYTGVKGTPVTVDGTASSDADGSITNFSWSFGDEIVVNAADAAATTIVGTKWARVSASGAAGGKALQNADKGAAKITTAAAAPSSYVEAKFYAAAGVPYHLWFRMQAEDNAYTNDSMFVQFSGAVTAQGAALNRIGTTSAGIVVLEEGNGAGLSGWGWNDEAYGTLAVPVYFATSGIQTIRLQQREDGLSWDQLVLSAGTYFSKRPGLTRSDSTIVTAQRGSGMVTSHVYPAAGQYPVRLTVIDNAGASATAATTATIGSTTAPPSGNVAPIARAGGPYTGTRGAQMTVDGSASSDSDGSIAAYRWLFGDEIVVRAADLPASRIVGTKWVRVNVVGAAGGVALHNPDKGVAKIGAASAAPTSYVEAPFYAAAGVPYHLWFRMKAQNDSYTNDSMFVQFSGAVNAQGAAVNRIGTSAAGIVFLEEGNGAGLSGWGWNDESYGALAAPVYFKTSGLQTLRLQQREDGIMWDQLVLSAGRYLSARPGTTRSDSTVVAAQAGSGAVASHSYPAAGQYPVRLTVTDNDGAVGTADTVATIK
jgi:hypothetical protein